MAQEPGQKRGPETDAKDRGRLKRLERAVHDIMGSDAFLEALEETRTDGRALAELKANPKAHLGRKGIGIPEEWRWNSVKNHPGVFTYVTTGGGIGFAVRPVSKTSGLTWANDRVHLVSRPAAR